MWKATWGWPNKVVVSFSLPKKKKKNIFEIFRTTSAVISIENNPKKTSYSLHLVSFEIYFCSSNSSWDILLCGYAQAQGLLEIPFNVDKCQWGKGINYIILKGQAIFSIFFFCFCKSLKCLIMDSGKLFVAK